MRSNPGTCAVWPAVAPVLPVHGGAGRIVAGELDAARVAAASRGLHASLMAGMAVLRDGGSALDAVVAAVAILEDDEQFNAGRGAVLTVGGGVEHDAAVADGATRRAGAVTCVNGVRNPVRAARAVMDRTPHVLLSGDGALELARREGLELAPTGWFVTARRQKQLATLQRGCRVESEMTGGSAGQLAGRIGDTPLLGAGTWADDRSCAVSATGDGEAFILSVFAHEVDALVRLAGLDLGAACDRALQEVSARRGTGGCIGVRPDGTVAMPFTSPGMFRGWIDAAGNPRVGMFAGDLCQ